MTTLIRLLFQQFKYLLVDIVDPRTKDWFLIGPPWIIVALELFYILFVYYIGPAFMAQRRPYQLKKLLVVYNIVQIFVNLHIVIEGFRLGWGGKYKLICEPVDYSLAGLEVAGGVWKYYLVKVFDLFDTAFYIFQKKYHKLTFLHVYHHGGMIILAWTGVRYVPGGHITSLGVINSIVHIIMYTHYLWTTLNWSKPWWKKHLTQLQITQFALIFIHFLLAVLKKDCDFPKWPILIFLPQNLVMTLLFVDFYYKTYIRKKPTNVDQSDLKKTESKQNGIECSNEKSKKH